MHHVPAINGGQLATIFYLHIHMTRNVTFYMLKCLAPTWGLGLLTFKMFIYDPSELADRDSWSITLLLATLVRPFPSERHPETWPP